jgi:hypothetical protein
VFDPKSVARCTLTATRRLPEITDQSEEKIVLSRSPTIGADCLTYYGLYRRFREGKTRAALGNARFLAALGGQRALVGWGCRRRDVRLLGEAALALGFADVTHCAVEVGVGTVGRIPDHASDDERGLRGLTRFTENNCDLRCGSSAAGCGSRRQLPLTSRLLQCISPRYFVPRAPI